MLSEEQSEILSYFENLEKDYQYRPPSKAYIQSSNVQRQVVEKQMAVPLFDEVQFEAPYDEVREKLKEYKEKSNTIWGIGQLIHEYDSKFEEMLNKKDDLLNVISEINSETSNLVQKQKKYIDLSVGVKEALDYYLYMDKFQFNWACEISCREMFEDQLQPTLSELTDGIDFFTENPNYSGAKKYLSLYNSNKQKVTSFTKSFFVKLFNKQYSFSIKYAKQHIWNNIMTFYPKSKPKFLIDFLTCFPQLKKELHIILSNAKYSISEEELSLLQSKEFQIEEFQLTDASLSLISYIQKNIRDVYEEIILKFIAFYRGNLHENLYKNISTNIPSNASFCDLFREKFIAIAYVIMSEAAYLSYCFKPCTEIASEYLRVTISKISEYYTQFLCRFIKDPRNKDPFQICEELTFLSEEVNKFVRNYGSKEYQTYALGAVFHFIEEKEVEFTKNVLFNMIKKLKAELEPVCHYLLPKIQICDSQKKVTQQVQILIQTIPQLRYCSNSAQKYLINCLDAIVKSIKTVNTKIQTRIQCYAWNIQVFGAIEECLEKIQFNIVKKQIRLDLQQTTSVIDRVRQVERGESIFKYATDIFNALRTGVPTLNELTLNYDKFITEYYAELRDKFRKDMVFIHGKSMIQFLQSVKEANTEPEKLFKPLIINNLYEKFVHSLDNFAIQEKEILKQRKQYALLNSGEDNLKGLLSDVWESLLKVLQNFYLQVNKFTEREEKFLQVSQIRNKYSDFIIEKERKI